jgi:hypothetical protein
MKYSGREARRVQGDLSSAKSNGVREGASALKRREARGFFSVMN